MVPVGTAAKASWCPAISRCWSCRRTARSSIRSSGFGTICAVTGSPTRCFPAWRTSSRPARWPGTGLPTTPAWSARSARSPGLRLHPLCRAACYRTVVCDRKYTQVRKYPEIRIISARFAAINAGDADAKIIEVRAIIHRTTSPLPMTPPPMNDIIGGGQIVKPAVVVGFFECVDTGPIGDELDGILEDHDIAAIYVMGFVMYTDTHDDRHERARRTYFCRRLRLDPLRFERVENEDYEAGY